MPYDPKCLELAEYFLPGNLPTTRLADELAQYVQDAVEEFLHHEAAKLTADLNPAVKPN